MENLAAATVAEVFISCKKERHYSREVMLPQPALVRVISGEIRIAAADQEFHFYAGDTMLIPRNRLGRMSKIPLGGEPCVAISVVFRQEVLRKYYEEHPITETLRPAPLGMVLDDHPLLDSLFNSLIPYFELTDALPPDLAVFKMEEAIRELKRLSSKG